MELVLYMIRITSKKSSEIIPILCAKGTREFKSALSPVIGLPIM